MAALGQLEKLPESVRDSKLRAAFRYDGHQQYVVHPRGLRGRLEQKEDVWTRIKTIGAGGNGSVDLQCRESPRTGLPTQLRAVKNIRIPEAELISNRDFYVRELEAIAKFSSLRYGDLFVKSLGWFTSEDTIHIAMEYCKLGDLQMFLFDKCPGHRLPEDQTREIASQVVEAISCMHEEYFAHRDIKPANILIQSHPPESPWAVKLADFGISRRSLGHEMNSTTTRRGTPVFWPPELHGFVTSDTEGYGNLYATDMWCFGETLFRVLTGQATFGNVAKLSKFAFGQIDFPEAILKDLSVSDGGIAFLRSLIVCNPIDRLTALDALEHPWFDQDIPNSYWEQPSTPLTENANATDLPYRHQETTGPSAVWPTRSSLEDVGTARQRSPSTPASQPSKQPQSAISPQLRPSTRDEQPILEGWETTVPTTASASWPTERSENQETREQINSSIQPQFHRGHSDIQTYPRKNLEIRRKSVPLVVASPQKPGIELSKAKEMFMVGAANKEPQGEVNKEKVEAMKKEPLDFHPLTIHDVGREPYLTSFQSPISKLIHPETNSDTLRQSASNLNTASLDHQNADKTWAGRVSGPRIERQLLQSVQRSSDTPPPQSDEQVERPINNTPGANPGSDSLAKIIDNANIISGKNSTTSNAEDDKEAMESNKELPLVPAAFEPRDRISFLTFNLQELANRRVNLGRAIDQSASLLPKDSLWSSAEERRKREEGKKKIEAIREELSEVQKEEYELGLKLHRAYKRQDQEKGFPRHTGTWIKRVTNS